MATVTIDLVKGDLDKKIKEDAFDPNKGVVEISFIKKNNLSEEQKLRTVDMFKALGYKVKVNNAEDIWRNEYVQKLDKMERQVPKGWTTKIDNIGAVKHDAVREWIVENTNSMWIYTDLRRYPKSRESAKDTRICKGNAVVRKVTHRKGYWKKLWANITRSYKKIPYTTK